MNYPLYSDEFFMNEALKEAQIAFEENEVPVGAVVVTRNIIIARAHNMTESLSDVTAHAEMLAITAAENYLGNKYLNECSLYVTLEPCVMCAYASSLAQMGSLVTGATDPKAGYSLLQESVLHPKTIVKNAILSAECGDLLTKFFKLRRNKLR